MCSSDLIISRSCAMHSRISSALTAVFLESVIFVPQMCIRDRGEDVRPTTDRVKEAVFSIIQFEIEGRRVLDLFAGSGQLLSLIHI